MDFLSSLIDEAARPHRFTEHELRDRAQVLLGLTHFSALLADESVRGDVPLERAAELMAELLIDGIGGKP